MKMKFPSVVTEFIYWFLVKWQLDWRLGTDVSLVLGSYYLRVFARIREHMATLFACLDASRHSFDQLVS